MSRRCPWSVLVRRHSITTVAGQESYDPPEDARSWLDGTWWDETSRWPLIGPALPREWQAAQVRGGAGLARRMFRISGDGIGFFPVPAVSGQAISLDYVTRNWCLSASGAARATWEADSDTALLDEDLIRMGVKCRFLKEKGLPWEGDYAEYERELRSAVARDGGATSLSMTGGGGSGFPPLPQVPESGFGA